MSTVDNISTLVFLVSVIQCGKTTVICPIYKGKGCTDEPGHYRGISVLSILRKMFSGILTGR
jgi:hypothetical protein